MRRLIILFLLLGAANGAIIAQSGLRKALKDRREKKSFHIYILAGQSNMAGRGAIEPQDTGIVSGVFVFDEMGNWVPARHPLHYDVKEKAGLGPGIEFARVIAEEDSDVLVGLIPCARGGSSIEHWFPGVYYESCSCYVYDDMIDRCSRALGKGVLKGIIWHQGESDCDSSKLALYSSRFLQFRSNALLDLGMKALPMVIGEIGEFYAGKKPLTMALNDTLSKIVGDMEGVSLISSDGLMDSGDMTHFNSASYRELGLRYGKAMIELKRKYPSKPFRRKMKKRNARTNMVA